MAFRKLMWEVAGMKVKDVPSHIKPLLTKDKAKGFIGRGLDKYHKKYIMTESDAPLLHVCFGGMLFSYLVALPEERRHLAHAQHAKHKH